MNQSPDSISVPDTCQVRVRQVSGTNLALHRFAWIAAACTFLLICVGSLVTSFGVGLAVPDWPTTFEENMFTYNWFKSPSTGVFIEHGHRLAGATVGLLTLILAIWIWVSESRKWLRNLGLIALTAVCVQGVMGGLRVSQISQGFALLHGAFAQAFFALMVSIAVFTSPAWSQISTGPSAQIQKLRRLAIITTAMVYLQIIAGAVLRHTGQGLLVHLFLAFAVLMHLFLLVRRVWAHNSENATFTKLTAILSALSLLQLLLGFAAWATTYSSPTGEAVRGQSLQVLVGSLHVAVGSLLLMTSLGITLFSFRLEGKEEAVKS